MSKCLQLLHWMKSRSVFYYFCTCACAKALISSICIITCHFLYFLFSFCCTYLRNWHIIISLNDNLSQLCQNTDFFNTQNLHVMVLRSFIWRQVFARCFSMLLFVLFLQVARFCLVSIMITTDNVFSHSEVPCLVSAIILLSWIRQDDWNNYEADNCLSRLLANERVHFHIEFKNCVPC